MHNYRNLFRKFHIQVSLVKRFPVLRFSGTGGEWQGVNGKSEIGQVGIWTSSFSITRHESAVI